MKHRLVLIFAVVLAVVALAGFAGPRQPRAMAGGLARAPVGGYSASFTISGPVASPRTYTLADLEALPSESVDVQFRSGAGMEQHTYQGVRLADLLLAATPQFGASRKNDNIDWYVHVTATDGYQAVVAWGEFGQGWEGKDILVAYAADGQLLGDADGMARLVVPGDQMGGRYVSNITSIELLRAGN